MNVCDYIKKKYYNSSAQILNGEKNKILEKAKKRTKQFSNKYSELEQFLTDIFYGQNGKTFLHNITNIYSELTNKHLGELQSWDNMTTAINSDSFDAIASQLTQKAGEYVHKAQIKKQTVENRKVNLEKYKIDIERIINSGDLDALSLELYSGLKTEVENVIKIYENFLKEVNKTGLQSNQFITSRNYFDLFIKVDELDKIYSQFIQKMDILPSDIGNLLEIALVLLSSYGSKIVEKEVSEEGIKYFADSLSKNSRWKGPSTFSRNGLDLSSVISVKYDSYIEKNKSNMTVRIPCGKNTILTTTASFQTKFDNSKQGKADVIFTLPNTSETFSISAKNWKDLFLQLKTGKFIIQDFGSTSLAAALSRSNINSLSFEHWLYALGPREASESQLQAAHMLAQVAIGADILMGYSQKKGAIANTIVINNRKAKRIQVLSVMDLLNDIDNGISDKVSISNYNSSMIRAEAKNIFDNLYSWRTLGSNYYKGSLISYINNIHVTVKINPFL